MHWSYHWSSCSQTVVAMWCNVNEVHQSIPKRVHVGWCWLERSIAETTIRRCFHCDVLSSESWPQCMKWVKVTTLRAEHAKGERLEQWCSYLLYDPHKYTRTILYRRVYTYSCILIIRHTDTSDTRKYAQSYRNIWTNTQHTHRICICARH